jgi:hypothetical protein
MAKIPPPQKLSALYYMRVVGELCLKMGRKVLAGGTVVIGNNAMTTKK